MIDWNLTLNAARLISVAGAAVALVVVLTKLHGGDANFQFVRVAIVILAAGEVAWGLLAAFDRDPVLVACVASLRTVGWLCFLVPALGLFRAGRQVEGE